jgi:hypothetical protein
MSDIINTQIEEHLARIDVSSNPIDDYISRTDISASQKIRYLDSKGFKRSTIAKMLTHKNGSEMRYQMVKNVLDRELKRS